MAEIGVPEKRVVVIPLENPITQPILRAIAGRTGQGA